MLFTSGNIIWIQWKEYTRIKNSNNVCPLPSSPTAIDLGILKDFLLLLINSKVKAVRRWMNNEMEPHEPHYGMKWDCRSPGVREAPAG